MLIGLILSSAFPAIVVFAQELVPGRVGMIAGIFFGFAFGMAGIAAAVLGVVADAQGIDYVYQSLLVPAVSRPADRLSSAIRWDRQCDKVKRDKHAYPRRTGLAKNFRGSPARRIAYKAPLARPLIQS